MDLTQENLPPAVPVILVSLILSEAQNREQFVRAARWFLKVGEEGFRFGKANQMLEFLRRAMELRRGGSATWDGSDVWRAREDHTIVAQGSRVRLERQGGHHWERTHTKGFTKAEKDERDAGG